jgi:hypothetical protein
MLCHFSVEINCISSIKLGRLSIYACFFLFTLNSNLIFSYSFFSFSVPLSSLFIFQLIDSFAMISAFGRIDVPSVIEELRHSRKELSLRFLHSSSLWCSEQLAGLKDHKGQGSASSTMDHHHKGNGNGSASSMHHKGKSGSDVEMSEDDEDVYAMAMTFMHRQEFLRAANALSGMSHPRARFLNGYHNNSQTLLETKYALRT